MAGEVSQSRSPVASGIGAIVTIVLTILGLAHVAPNFLVAIATIAFGATLLLYGSMMLGEYVQISSQAGSASAAVSANGLSSVLLAGAAGVILGILALLGISPVELTAIAVIGFGSALILSSNGALRLHLLKLAVANQPAQQLADALAGEMLSSAAGIYGLAGLAAIVLGILALAGFSPVILVLIALLQLGSVSIINGLDIAKIAATTFHKA